MDKSTAKDLILGAAIGSVGLLVGKYLWKKAKCCSKGRCGKGHCDEQKGDYELVYFDIRGRAEIPRMLMEESGVSYKNTKVNRDEMKVLKATGELAFSQVPLLRHGGMNLVQSNAIIRYLGRQLKRYGSNALERALIDAAMDGAEDWRLKYLSLIYVDQLSDAAKTKYVNEVAKVWFGYFEIYLLKNNAGQGWFVGNQLSIADFSIYEELDKNTRLFPEIINEFPALKGFKQRFENIPSIAAYFRSGRRPAAVNGNGMG